MPITYEQLSLLSEQDQQWYLTSYPFLKDFNFPPDPDFLQGYYNNDMNARNLTPLKTLFENYDFLFSYFLKNYPLRLDEQFVAPNWFQRLIQDFPTAIKKTGSDIGSVTNTITDFFGNFSIILLIGLALIAIIMVSK